MDLEYYIIMIEEYIKGNLKLIKLNEKKNYIYL